MRLISDINIRSIKFLLEAGEVDIDKFSCYSDTEQIPMQNPLSYAAKTGNYEIVKLLIEYGANVNGVGGNTIPIMNAMESIDQFCISWKDPKYLKYKDIILLLLSNNADVNLTNELGETPLISAVQLNYEDDNFNLVDLLLNNGANVNQIDNEDISALMYAVFNDNIPDVLLLLEHGANVNQVNNEGISVLMLAISAKNTNIVDILLRTENIDLEEANRCLHIAIEKDFENIVELIRNYINDQSS